MSSLLDNPLDPLPEDCRLPFPHQKSYQFAIELINEFIDALIPKRKYHATSRRLLLSAEEVTMLHRLALVGHSWLPRSRYWTAQALLTELPERRHVNKLQRILVHAPLPFTYTDSPRQVRITMHEAEDVAHIQPNLFTRGSVRLGTEFAIPFRRATNPFIDTLNMRLGSNPLARVLYDKCRFLSLHPLWYPNHIFNVELDCLAQAFSHVTTLELSAPWCTVAFRDAVKFLHSFPSLETLRLGQLMVMEEDEEASWSLLDDTPTPDAHFPHLTSVTLEGRWSPYTLIAFLTSAPFPRLTELDWGLGNDHVHRLCDPEKTARHERISMMLSTIETLTLTMMEGTPDCLDELDLLAAERLQMLKLNIPPRIGLTHLCERKLPTERLTKLTIEALTQRDDVEELDHILHAYPKLQGICYPITIKRFTDFQDAMINVATLHGRMRNCKDRDLLIPVVDRGMTSDM